jgi:hypothetical protein
VSKRAGPDALDQPPGFVRLGFSGPRFLIVSFLTHQGNTESPLSVHCIVLGAERGRVLGQHEWFVPRLRVGLLPTEGGRLVVRQQDGLDLYSPKFRVLARLPLGRQDLGMLARRHDTAQEPRYFVEATPDQEQVVVEKWLDRDSIVHVTWLNADTLAVRRARTYDQDVTLQPYAMFSLSAGGKTVLQIFGYPAARPGLYVRGPDGRPRRVLADPRAIQLTAMFVTNSTILASSSRRALLLLDEAGRVLFSQSLPTSEYVSAYDARASADGTRLAVPILRNVGVNNELLGLRERLVVKRIEIRDLATARSVCQLDGKHPSLGEVTALALSPHGRRLALLRNGAVELYRLPE